MEKIEKRYLHYNTESGFLKDKNSGKIDPKSIVFISEKGKRAIYTHGKFYSTDSFVIGTQTSPTSTFKGTYNGVEELYDGFSIKYWLPYSSIGEASLDLTIQGSSTGSIPIYTKNNTRFNDTEAENCILFLTYRENVEGIGQGWWVINGSGGKNYSFASGTNGSFTVTDEKGNNRTISVGKPETAGIADSVTNPLIIQIESGEIEGTDLYTFDGKESKVLNIKGDGGTTLSSNEEGEILISSKTYSNATTSAAGLMSAKDKQKLNSLNNYSHPEHTESSLGFYKVSVDELGHVNNTDPVIISDLTNLGALSESKNVISTSSTGVTESTGNKVYLNTVNNSNKVSSSYKISGSGITSVSSKSGEIIIESTPIWDSIPDKPDTFNPSSHSHNLSELNNVSSKKININGLDNNILYTGTDNLPSTIVVPTSLGEEGKVLKSDGSKLIWGDVVTENTWRPVYITSSTGTNTKVTTDTGNLYLSEGNNITLTKSKNGVIEISSLSNSYSLEGGYTNDSGSEYKVTLKKGENADSSAIIPVFNGTKIGLVPLSTTADSNKFLKADGSWSDIPFRNVSTSGSGYAPQLKTSTTEAISGYYALMWDGKNTTTSPSWIKIPEKAFSWRTIKVNGVSVSSDKEINFVKGNNITLTENEGTITISSTYKNSLSKLYIGAKDKEANAASTDGNDIYLKLFDGSSTTPYQFKFTGTGGTSLSTDASGNLTINSIVYTGNNGVTVKGTNISHSTVNTEKTDNTSTASALGYGSEFTIPTSLTISNGHITGYTLTKYSLPLSDNTDEKVKITNTTASGDYKVLFSYSTSDNTLTEGARKSKKFLANPGTGKFTSEIFKSTAPEGTAPLEVTSKTLVSNLNAEYLGGYTAAQLAKLNHTHDYLPLSGGTLNSGTNFDTLTIKRESTQGVAIHFENSDGYRGSIGFRSSSKDLLKWDDKGTSGTVYTFLDSGNTSIAKKDNTVTLTIPGSSATSWNEDKVKQTNSATNSNYPVLLAYSSNPTSGSLGSAYYNKAITVNPSTGNLSATTFSGELDGTISSNTTAITQSSDTSNNTVATTEFVKNVVGSSVGGLAGAMVFKGTISSPSKLPANHEIGWTYRIEAEGTYAGQHCEIGDLIICIQKGSTQSNSHWTVGQNNIDGAVTCNSTVVKDSFASFSSSTGKVIKDSGYSAIDFTYKAQDGHLVLTENSTTGKTFSLATTKVTAGMIGRQPGTITNNVTQLSHTSKDIVVPQIEFDSYGRAINAVNVTVKLPTLDGVLQKASTATTPKPILLHYYSASSPKDEVNTAYYSSKATITPKTGEITSEGGFIGNLTGTASYALKLIASGNTSGISLGGTETPVYFDRGVPSSCTQYAGGTQVKMNGSSYSGSTVEFYAPTVPGTPGMVLTSDGANGPEWKDLVSAGSNSGTYSTSVGTSWATFLSATTMGTLCKNTGTYVIQLSGTKTGICSGIFSWNSSGSTEDEILLHRTGATTNVYLKLKSRSLQIAGASSFNENIKVTVKKLI